MPDPELLTVEVRRVIAASVEQVYAAWMDPAIASRFLFATPEGEMVWCEIDVKVGGKLLFVDRRNGQDVEHAGEYLVLDPPRLLVFRYGLPAFSDNMDRVSVAFRAVPEGCEITLTHEMDPQWREYADRTRAGWTTILDSLAGILEA